MLIRRSYVWRHLISLPLLAVAAVAAVAAFAARIAWKNLDAVNAVVQRWTISSLVLFAIIMAPMAVFGGYFVLGHFNDHDFVGAIDKLIGLFIEFFISLIALASALAVFLLRRRTIYDLDIRLVDLMHFVISNRTVGVAHKLPPKHKWRGRVLVGGGLLTMVVARGIGDSLGPFGGAAPPGTMLAFFMLLHGRACLQPSAETLLKADSRSPVLLLRSFIDDQCIKYSRARGSFLDFSLESRIATYFSKIGPFIAISSPKDRRPVIGAARAALDDTEWQGRVIEWIDSSCFWVVMVGASHWVAWELREVVERGHIGKLIILFPEFDPRHLDSLYPDSPYASDRRLAASSSPNRSPADRLATIAEGLQGTPWEIALREIKDPWSIRSLVFDDDGHVSMVTAKSLNRNSYHLAAVIAHFLILRRRVDQQLVPISRSNSSPRNINVPVEAVLDNCSTGVDTAS